VGSGEAFVKKEAHDMTAYLIVALGSAIGGALRHGVNVGAARLMGTGWPYGTFAVNVLGSFAMGVLAGYFAFKGIASQRSLLFLTTGVLGGFTTFSAFSLDVALLFEQGRLGAAASYVLGSVALSIGALLLGPRNRPVRLTVLPRQPRATDAKLGLLALALRCRRRLHRLGLVEHLPARSATLDTIAPALRSAHQGHATRSEKGDARRSCAGTQRNDESSKGPPPQDSP
jgi:CrcB protein